MLTLKVGQRAPIVIALIDTVTQQPAANAGATEIIHATVDENIARVDGGNLVGVGQGTTDLSSSAKWTYVDSLGQPQSKTITMTTSISIQSADTANPVEMQVTLGSVLS